MSEHLPARPVQIDVGKLVRRSVASLYSTLVTRPTGRAVRLAIETQMGEGEQTAFGLIDLSEVTVIDFSCADEVIAKLLMRYLQDDRPHDAFFVFRGVAEFHRDPIEAVLDRQRLAAVALTPDGGVELLGTRTDHEARAWQIVESRGRLEPDEAASLMPAEEHDACGLLVERRLVFQAPHSGEIHALSRFVSDLI